MKLPYLRRNKKKQSIQKYSLLFRDITTSMQERYFKYLQTQENFLSLCGVTNKEVTPQNL